MWAPLVTWVIGTSSTGRSGHRSCHISRATSPWRALTPLAIRLERSANCVTPNGSAASSGWVRPRRTSVSGSTPISAAMPPSVSAICAAGYVSLPAGTGVWVVNTVRWRTASNASSTDAPVRSRSARASSRQGHRRVALVEVHDPGLDAERVQRAHAPDAEQRVLAQAHAGVADVQPRGDPAVGEVVLRAVGVEQEERHAADVDPPHLSDDRALADRDADGQRLAVLAAHERGRHPVRVGLDPVLVLPAQGVDALAEVAVAVHEPDRHHRKPHVGGLLEDVAGQHPEAARVDGQRLVDRVLGAEERGRAVLGHRAVEQRLRQLLGDGGGERVHAVEEAGVAGQLGEPRGRDLAQQPHRVAEAQLPAAGVDRGEQLRAAGRPGPAVVVGQVRERRERFGQRASGGPRRPRRCRESQRSPLICSECRPQGVGKRAARRPKAVRRRLAP